MVRTWTFGAIFMAATAALLFVWWEFPNIRNDDKGYTALGALLSALGFAALLLTLILQHSALRAANAAHDEMMAQQRDATRITAAGAIVTALSASIEYIDPELTRTRQRIDAAKNDAVTEAAAAIARIDERLRSVNLDESALKGDVQRILSDVAFFGLDLNDELKGAMRSERELEAIKLDFLKQISAAAAACAGEYERVTNAAVAEGEADAPQLLALFRSIYKLRLAT